MQQMRQTAIGITGKAPRMDSSMVLLPTLSFPPTFMMPCNAIQKYNLTPWPEVYPTDNILIAGKNKPDRALVVDIGGSKGHDLKTFYLYHPDIPDGSLILQDLPEVVKDLKLSKAISPQEYDFFTEQPVKGAAAYFIHNVLHDWNDEKATSILKTVANSMEKCYSRLLIHGSIISAVKPLARVTTSDITMMACLSVQERDEGEWRRLIENAGLKVVKIWRPARSVESIIETEVAEANA